MDVLNGATNLEIIEAHTRQQYKLLGHEGFFTQCHAQEVNTNELISRELVCGADQVVKWARSFNGKANLFIGRNPRTSTGAVARVTSTTIDIDPKRAKGTAATEAQYREAIRAGNKAAALIAGSYVATSGNGALVIVPFEEALEVSPELTKTLRDFEEYVRQQVATETINVDSTYDIPRLVKLMGSLSCKGDIHLRRPAKFLSDTQHRSAGRRGAYGRVQELAKSISANNADGGVDALRSSSVDNRSNASTLQNSERLNLAEQSLRRLSKGRCDEYDSWLRVGIALKEFGDVGYRMWADWSKQSHKFDESALRDKWQSFRGDQQLTIGTLVSWAKQDDPEGRFNVQQPNTNGVLERHELVLWTPDNGMGGYEDRRREAEPEFPTGFKVIDTKTGGLIRGSIFTVGGRTNCGKTAFAVTVAESLCRSGKRVLYFSTETQYQEIWDRYFAVGTGISAFQISNGTASDDERRRLENYVRGFRKDHQFTVYDGSAPTYGLVRAAVKQIKPDVVVFDYFQHIAASETKELEGFVRDIKDLAKEFNIAVLMCAQLHDGRPDPRTGKVAKPTMIDMKSCKALNDESRVVLLLDWARDKEQTDGPVAVSANIAKNKGSCGEALLCLERNVPRFKEA